jgi:hypothetical protein
MRLGVSNLMTSNDFFIIKFNFFLLQLDQQGNDFKNIFIKSVKIF